MARPRGRDQAPALQRVFQILSLLAGGGSQGVLRDTLETEVDLGPALPEDRLDILRRELRNLRDLGWQIRVEGQGELTRWFLEDKDPRLHTVLDQLELQQLTRAAHKGGRDPQKLGLAVYVGGTLPFPVEIRTTDIFFLEEFLHALNHRCLVKFTYAGKQRTLHVDDVHQTSAGVWLIIGREDGSSDQKRYRIDRIDRIERPGQSAESEREGQPGQAGQSAESGQVGQSAESGQVGQPREVAQSAQAAQPGQAGQSAESGQVGQLSKPAEAEQAGQPREASQADQPARFEVGPPGSASARQPDRTTSDPLLIPDGFPVEAQVTTTPDHEDRVIADLGQPKARHESNGQIVLTIPVVNRQLWRQRLYGLGTLVRLLGPSELRDEVRAELLEFLPGRRA